MSLKRSTKNLQAIGTRLLEERLRLGLSQQQMADLGGVSRPSYRLYEEGKREPALGYMMRLSDEGADIVYLLFGSTKRKRIAGAICLSEKTLGILFDNATEVIAAEYGDQLTRRSKRKLFVDMCKLAASSYSEEVDTTVIYHELETLRS